MSPRLALRTTEVAEQIGVHKATVQRWIATGALTSVRVGVSAGTPALPKTVVATVDHADGSRVDDAVLTVRHIVGLTCGCLRYECDRPGGGQVHVLRGDHCEQIARPSPPAVPESLPA